MGNLLNRDEVRLPAFSLDALEELPLSGNTRRSAEEWRAELAGSRGKTRRAVCEALPDGAGGVLAETRNALGLE